MSSTQEGSLYREPTCYEKCVLGFKCGAGTGFVFSTAIFGVGAMKTKLPRAVKARSILLPSAMVSLTIGTIFTAFVRYNC